MVALLIALGLTGISSSASALTLPVTGGPGLDQGEICAVANLCPGTPVLSLTSPGAATGSFTYNAGPGTVDLVLTLTGSASFGGGVAQLLPGTTFTATGIPVMNFPLGGGAFLLAQAGAASAVVAPLNFSVAGGGAVIANTPVVSGLQCTVGTGTDQCGVSFGSSGLTFSSVALGGNYKAFVTFNVNVPEPGTLATLAFGIAGLAVAGRSRRA